MATQKPKARRMLSSIRWKETSGVDHPANEEEGWLVMKSRDELTPEELEQLDSMLKVETEAIKNQEQLFGLLGRIDTDEVSGKVKAAVGTLQTWLKSEGFGDEDKKKSEDDDADKAAHGDEDNMPPRRRRKLMDAIREAIRQTFGKVDEPELDELEVAKVMVAEWPAFCETISKIVKQEIPTEEKQSAAIVALDQLREKVETAIAA